VRGWCGPRGGRFPLSTAGAALVSSVRLISVAGGEMMDELREYAADISAAHECAEAFADAGDAAGANRWWNLERHLREEAGELLAGLVEGGAA